MYTIYCYRSSMTNTFNVNDFHTACVIAFNEVYYFGYEIAHITTNETGEILRTYSKN